MGQADKRTVWQLCDVVTRTGSSPAPRTTMLVWRASRHAPSRSEASGRAGYAVAAVPRWLPIARRRSNLPGDFQKAIDILERVAMQRRDPNGAPQPQRLKHTS